jgi:prophage antirepressor-like protein
MESINELKYENDVITIIKDNDNDIWFNIYQSGVILDYKNPKKIIKELVSTNHIKLNHIKFLRNIVKDYKLYPNTPSKVLYIHQIGLYTLMIRSKKPYVEKFLKWITQEVIPSIGYKKMDTILTNTNTIEDVIPSIGYKKRDTINIIVI